jgi:methylenetetrahydrofolate dehydrogenase (NADP+)/methenyltetrahydrofolate cyclohydrolase
MSTILMAGPVRLREVEILKERTKRLKQKGITPTLKVILVGNFRPSLIYTRSKKKFIEQLGGICEIIHLPEDIQERDFISEIQKISDHKLTQGCFVQLPLPRHLQHIEVGNLIPAHKDVDGFHQKNIYCLFKGQEEGSLIPCTPKGILTLLEFFNIDLKGKHVVILGRSQIVGRPLALLLLNHHATVTVCHSLTKDLKEVTKRADIIVSAIGKAKFLNRHFLDQNSKPVIIDVGINQDENGKICGDVDFDDVKDFTQAISPVPGGVGPMTILSLAQNLLLATEKGL